MPRQLPDSIRYSNDPEISARFASPDGYQSLLEEYGEEPEDLGTPTGGTPPPSGQTAPEPPQPSGDDPPAGAPAPGTEPAGSKPAGQQDTPSPATPADKPDDAPIFTEAETKKLIRLGIVDQEGRFLGKYGSADKMLEAISHKDRVISSKFGEYIKAHPDEAKELLVDTGVVDTPIPRAAQPAAQPAAAGMEQPPNSPEHMPGQPAPGQPAPGQPAPGVTDPYGQPQGAPTPSAIVDSVVKQVLPPIDAVLAEEYKADLEEIGVSIPTDQKGWRDLFDVSPGLATELRDRYNSIAHEQQQTRAFLENAARHLEERRQNRTAYEQGLVATERQELLAAGYPEELVTKAQEELQARRPDDFRADLNYYDDADSLGNRLFVPVLRQGALRAYLMHHHSDELMQAQIEAKVQEKLGKERDWREGKQRRAGLFPPTIIGGAGAGKDRAMLSGLHPTPDQYWDDAWRLNNLRTHEDRESVRRWVESLPEDQRRPYRYRN